MLKPGKIYEIKKARLLNFLDCHVSEANNRILFRIPCFKTGDKVLILKEETNVVKLTYQKAFYWVFNLTQGRKMGLCVLKEAERDLTEHRFKEIEF